MAAERSLQSLRDEVTCPVCLELFRDPVMILGCGHNFCRACITQCWEGAETDVTCPQCRQTFAQRLLGPNRQLANVVEVVKGLNVGSVEGAGGKMVCEQHGEALKLFCETDQVLMCVICRESRVHRAHPVAPIQEAAQQCKQKAAAERQKIVAAFEQLRQFLEEQERLVLAELGELESRIEESQGETVTQLSEEISHLNSLIRELEGKCQQAASDLLQDMRSTLSRCRKEQFQLPEGICPELETRLSILSGQTLALQETLKFQETLPSNLEKGKGGLQGSFIKVTVTLDPDTANPRLVLSADRRSDFIKKESFHYFEDHGGVSQYHTFWIGLLYDPGSRKWLWADDLDLSSGLFDLQDLSLQNDQDRVCAYIHGGRAKAGGICRETLFCICEKRRKEPTIPLAMAAECITQ
ncbi:zinc finger protein RFP-like [Alligator mississippiensis]|uniref:Zinc finger protein RFP-like n=1 Tax=Alligator mississippiensis TaxID=8496 RepID=A0A151M5V1_ALLMI|nr:zinc finger protein RFP-like [Alligator mississippiensis]